MQNFFLSAVAIIPIFLYGLLTFFVHPLAILYLKYRVKKSKEDPSRYQEKLGIFDYNLIKHSNNHDVLWFHAASVGELKSIIPLLEALRKCNSSCTILVTTCTVTGYEVFHKANIKNSFHCYAPIDTPIAVQRFLKFWKPKLAIFIESELWPNTLRQTSKYCHLILCNARLSERSFAKWKYFSLILQKLLKYFKYVLASTEETAKILRSLDITIKYIGNLKYAAPSLYYDADELKKFSSSIGDRHVLFAASTHHPEERIFLNIYNKLLKNIPDLLLIIAPRHPERCKEIISLLNGIKYGIRSHNSIISKSTGVYIVDTIGDLGLFYRLASLVFVGGSIIPHGGQNMLEPARLGCPIIVGKHTFNFRDIMSSLTQQNAIVIAENEEDLYYKIEDLLLNDSESKKMADRASLSARKQDNSLEETLKVILNNPFMTSGK